MKKLLVASLIASALASGCATNQPVVGGANSGSVYDGKSASIYNSVLFGRAVDVRAVKINQSSTTGNIVGAILGGAVGALLGKNVASSGSNAQKLGTVAGTVGGAALGKSIAGAGNTVDGYEIVVRTTDGRTSSIVQEADTVVRQGACVKITMPQNGGNARVSETAEGNCK